MADLWGGYRDQEGTPWTRDAMSPSFSTTKGVTSTLLHIYADRGLINYRAPVAEYWPEFAQGGKQDITVRQVLSHQSGLYHIRQMIDRADRMLDWDHMVRAIEMTEPAHEDFDFGSPECLRVAIPAGNGLFTARSLAKMYAALANQGEFDGVRPLSEEAVKTATTRQRPTGRHSVIPFDMRWRLGYHSVMTTRGVPQQAFGHFGFGGSGAWADPERQLSVALIVNSGMGSLFGDMRTARISGAALQCADARERHSRRWSQSLLKTG